MASDQSGGQSYRERRPVSLLEHYVSCVWVQRVSPASDAYEHRSVPNGGVELSCLIGSEPRLTGPQTGPTVELLEPGAVVVGVRFRPGAAPPMLGVPASELVDVEAEADAVWGVSALVLGGRLAASASPEQAAAILEAELLARLSAAPAPDPVIGEVVRRLHPWCFGGVASLADSLDLSERQLRRLCRDAIGLAPKVLQRMLRFQGFLALAQARDADLARLAIDAGYADQSHLSRESTRLAGRSPAALLREAERSCRGLHDHAASYAPLLHLRALATA